MVSDILHQSASQRRAAWLALFAIALIVVAPLISVALQKDPMSGMHHAMMTMAEDAPSHQMTMMHTDASTPQRSYGVPLDHAEACGYCVLLAHVPGFIFALVLLLAMVLRRQRVPVSRPVNKHWHYFPWLYPLTRAPPLPSAFPLR